jgi:hypothetical protein
VGLLETSFEKYGHYNTNPMNRRYIIVVSIVPIILAMMVWRGCSKLPKQASASKPSPDFASGPNGPQRIKEPETKEEYEAVIREKSMAFAKRNNVNIAFYGRAIDQDSKPLQGVAVEYIITTIPTIPVPWGPSETKNETCVTDQNGLFSVEGKRGSGLDITGLAKQGYRKAAYYQQADLRYEPYDPQRYIPDRNKPVEFMLIRDDLPKAKEAYDKRLRLNWNADTTIADLGADIGKLEFTASRSGRDSSDTMKKFEWEVKMQAIGFTMTKLPNAHEIMAPLEGYGSNGRVGFSPDEKTWAPQSEASYAIRTSSGAYGLMNLSIYGGRDDSGTSGSVTVYLNKSGARNIDHK